MSESAAGLESPSEAASSSLDRDTDVLKELLSRPTAEQDAVYFAQLCADLGGRVSVRRHPGRTKGRGLFAERAFQKGELILKEAPILSFQDAENRTEALVCARCMLHAGRMEDQLHWFLLNKGELREEEASLMHLLESGELELPPLLGTEPEPVVYCECGAVYCSASCKEITDAAHHQYLCPERDPDLRNGARVSASGLADFERFCGETNPAFRLAAEMLCQCLASAVRRGNDLGSTGSEGSLKVDSIDEESLVNLVLQESWAPYWHAWRPLWWECLPVPPDHDDPSAFRAELKGLVQKASSLLQTAIRTGGFDILLSAEMIGSVMGMIEQNNISVSIPSPLELYIDQLNAAEDELVWSLWERYPGLKSTLVDAAQHTAEGSGYYRVACCANHSCIPNAKDGRREGIDTDHGLHLVAVRDIQAEEEITISYIDEEAEYEERKIALSDYGFVCDCEKCEKRE